MQIFFVIDNVENLDEKLIHIKSVFSGNMNYFVATKFYTKISSNSEIINSLAGVYNSDINLKINEYIHSDRFVLDECLVIYSSAVLTDDFLLKLRNKISYGYDAIYIKDKESFFSKIKDSIYSKIIKLMFNEEDALGSVKVQYMSYACMDRLTKTCFNNRIFKEKHSTTLFYEEKNKTLKTPNRFDKKSLLCLILFFTVLTVFVLIGAYFKLRFYIILLFVLLLVLSLVVSIMFAYNNMFHSRYGNLKDKK